MATVNPGDEVIVFEPTYDAYGPDVAMAGGVVRAVPLAPPDWRFDPERLAAAFGPRTRALILNTPHNPTGKVFSRAELETIAALCRRHDVLVISDEVYGEILFDGAAHVPIATLPEMFERTITIGSMGKTFSVTGWKVGWAIAPAALTAAVRAVHQFVTFTNSAPFQEALADVLPAAADERLLRAAARRLRPPPRSARARPARRRPGTAAHRRRVLPAHRPRPPRLHQRRRLLPHAGHGDRRRRDPDVRLLPAARIGAARRALLLREEGRDDPRGRAAARSVAPAGR